MIQFPSTHPGLTLLLALAFGSGAHGTTLTFQAGGTNGTTSDTWLSGGAPSTDHSNQNWVEWDGSDGGGQNFALVRFDEAFGLGVGRIAPTDQITSATLEYFVINAGSQGTVNEVLVDWNEGVTYATFGGDAGVQSDEYGAEVGVAIGSTGWRTVNVRSSIEAWKTSPADNRGWIVRPSRSDGVEFTSSEGSAATRVKLVVVVNEGEPPPVDVVRGPYLQRGTPNEAVIRWRTDNLTDSRVMYGPAPEMLTLMVDDTELVTEHIVELTGLDPATTYFYAIGTTEIMLAGGDDDHLFATSPVPGARPATRIWVIGDSGTANANAAAVYNAYRTATGSEYTDLWLMLGDNAYNDGTDAEYQAAVFEMYPELLRQTFLWATLGNHDGHTANSNNETGPYYEIFTFPRGGEAGGLPSGTEAYYAFDYGNIHFICLDSYETSTDTNDPMMTWLQNDVDDTLADWIIAFWHHPPYTKGSHDSDTEGLLIDMRERALPILEAAGVDLVLCGHSHSYERSFLLDGHYGTSNTLMPEMILDDGDGRESGDGAYDKQAGGPNAGAVYAVAGSSGKTSGGPLDHPAMFVSLNQLGSMILEIDGGRLDASFLRSNGLVGDTFTILKSVCVADLDVSGSVDFGDVLAILSAWGQSGGVEDLDDSGNVDFGDLLVVLAAWGPC